MTTTYPPRYREEEAMSGRTGRAKCADIVARDGWLWWRHDPRPIIAERDALRTQVERLREALQFVLDFKITDSRDQEVTEDSLHEFRKIARAALGEKP
jgi:hypothetical protein